MNYVPNNMYGYTYGMARPQARNTQPLTPEQIAKLRQDSNAFDMKIPAEDLWRAACTHKEKNGNGTLVLNNDGTYTCTICHETFNMCDKSRAEVESAVNVLLDMLQTSKAVYLDASEELVRQYYQMIPLLKKFPDLWDRALKNFSMYEGAMTGVNPMSTGYSAFAAYNTLTNNPYGGYGYMAPTPMAPQQPMGYYQQPTMTPYGMPVDPNVNPMAYGVPNSVPMPTVPQAAPAPGVMPGVPQMAPTAGVMPGVPQAAPVPTAPVTTPVATQQNEVQQQQTFNV